MSDGPTWRALLAEAEAIVGDRSDARRIVEEASGWDGAELALHLDDPSNPLTHRRWHDMVRRRAAGEPLQYVLGRWAFRHLDDVHVDRRALIPRPETEVVVDHALAAAAALDARVAVDLGTGTGVIALSLALERPGLTVWATDVSEDALAVARANLAGAGRAAKRVRLARGDWFAALPADVRGTVDVIVSNPPYVATTDDLPDEVRDWEPASALFAGPRGLDAIERITQEAGEWLRQPGALVCEIGETHADDAADLARTGGAVDVSIEADLAGRPRVLVAWWGGREVRPRAR